MRLERATLYPRYERAIQIAISDGVVTCAERRRFDSSAMPCASAVLGSSQARS